ncbi:MAG: TadE/TadG family type IV pilus assembly protein, partial [Acidimicrobiales bacterium]|nr:TadE/TadG family type IV pilus assembly protein [Acidimicrobiales bacterium]
GAVFLEFALVLPLLMALVLGIYTGGQAYTNKIGLVEAVREGARYGASLEMGDDVNALTTWKGLVRSRVVDASGGEVLPGDVCVEWVLPGNGTLCGLADPTGASNEPTVHLVKVSATRPAKMEFFFFTTNTTLVGQLVARFERDTG